jgi:hypothetical protein
MKIESVDKARYRKHLNIVIAICIVGLTGLSLAISQSMILLMTDGEGTHFWINLFGVVAACLIVGAALSKNRQNPFMKEVVYVWDLKQALNKVQRKLKQVEAAKDQNDIDAIAIMAFYYKACRQLYTLDDNTITLSELTIKANALERQIEELNLNINNDELQTELLSKY